MARTPINYAYLVCSKEFYEALDDNLKDCREVFKEIRQTLSQCLKTTLGEESTDFDTLRFSDRMKWPFNTDRMARFRNDLSGQKSDLTLKVMMIRLKRDQKERQLAERYFPVAAQ